MAEHPRDAMEAVMAATLFETAIQARSAELANYADNSMSPGQAGVAVREDVHALAKIEGSSRSTALGTVGRIAESQGAYRDALQQADPAVASAALIEAKRQREDITQRQAEYRASPEGIASAPQASDLRGRISLAEAQHDQWRAGRSYAELGPQLSEVATLRTDPQRLRDIDSRHEALQQVAAGALSTAAARELARLDAAAMSSFTDKSLQQSAAVVLGHSAEQYPSYKAALAEMAPSHARLAERAFSDDVEKSAEKDDRKSFEFGERRDDAAKEIATRYATMKQAGLSVNDLSGPAVERLAVMDSRALLLLEGQPQHAREGQARALVAESMKSPVYHAAFTRETAEWRLQGTGRQADATASISRVDAREQTAVAPSAAAEQKTPSKVVAEANTLRSVGDTAAKRPARPPLEDRFNIKAGLLATEYRFRDQAGKVAFTEKMFSLHTSIDSAAAVKAMVDRAAERGWQTVSLKGSAEFVRQGWIAAEARGLRSVGYMPTETDREAASKERTRMEAALQTEGSRQQREVTASGQAERVDRAERARRPGPIEQRQLNALIDKALVDARVDPAVIEKVRAMARSQGAARLSRGERFKVPVFDVKAPRARPKSVELGPQQLRDRERSR